MELEKKKTKVVKKTFSGPAMKYTSIGVPLIEDITDEFSIIHCQNVRQIQNKFVEGDLPAGMEYFPGTVGFDEENNYLIDPLQIEKRVIGNTCLEKCERTFITFSDEATFRQAFPIKKPPVVKQPKLCPITCQPARYVDPRTQCPFRNMMAFKVLREAYYSQLDAKIARGTVEGFDKAELEQWIQHRKQVNHLKAAQSSTKIRIDPNCLQLTSVTI